MGITYLKQCITFRRTWYLIELWEIYVPNDILEVSIKEMGMNLTEINLKSGNVLYKFRSKIYIFNKTITNLKSKVQILNNNKSKKKMKQMSYSA